MSTSLYFQKTKALCVFALIVCASLTLHSQTYDINQDSDKDGIMDEEDDNPNDKNLPYDSVLTYTICIGNSIDLNKWFLFPGLVMQWKSNGINEETAEGFRVTPTQTSTYNTVFYDSTTNTIIKELSNVVIVGNENLELKVDKIEKKSFAGNHGVNVHMNKDYFTYDWTLHGKYHSGTVMNIGRFYEDGLVQVIARDKYRCKDTLSFEIKMSDYYPEQEEQEENKISSIVNREVVIFKDLESAKGIVNMSMINGKYVGPYIYDVNDITSYPEQTFENIYLNIEFDEETKKGVWTLDKYPYNFKLMNSNSKTEVEILKRNYTDTGEIIILNSSVIRILYTTEDNPRLIEYRRIN